MARDRKSSQIRDLEGENRQLTKKVKQLQRDNARLKKMLGNSKIADEDNSKRRSYTDTDSQVLSGDNCELCGSVVKTIEMGFFKNQKRIIKVCQNADCGHRRVSYE